MILWSNEQESKPLPLRGDAVGPVTHAALAAWVREHQAETQARLRKYGALLFRGFGAPSLPEFEQFVGIFSETGLKRYIGGASSRKNVAGHVYTSTETAAHFNIAQHHESAYQRHMPGIIGFVCQIAAATGGETPLADSRRVYARLDPAIRERFERRGVRYINVLPNGFGIGKTWQAQFETRDRAEAEAHLRADDYAYEWATDGALRTAITCPAVITHPLTRDAVWVGQADHWHPSGLDPAVRARMRAVLPESQFPMNATYGDGSLIAEEDLAHIRQVIREETTTFPWQAGDLLICDNNLVSHGRRPYSGERRVLVALG